MLISMTLLLNDYEIGSSAQVKFILLLFHRERLYKIAALVLG